MDNPSKLQPKARAASILKAEGEPRELHSRMSFDGKRVRLAGNTRGVGHATVEAFLEAGARVVRTGAPGNPSTRRSTHLQRATMLLAFRAIGQPRRLPLRRQAVRWLKAVAVSGIDR